jgi:hypothetical protein
LLKLGIADDTNQLLKTASTPYQEPSGMNVSCPHCRGGVENTPDFALREVACPHCQQQFQMPAWQPAEAKGYQPLPPAGRNLKQCSFCGEQVQASALKCKHCGETIDAALRAAEEAKRMAERQPQQQVFMNAGGAAASSAAVSTVASSRYVRRRSSFGGWHAFHAIMTLITCGFWLPIWLIHWMIWASA